MMNHHYTNLNCLLSIIEKRQVWFTSLAFMNDISEGNYIFELIQEELMKPAYSKLIDAKALLILKSYLTEHAVFNFSFSATSSNEDLNQWRSYTLPGQGVCMSFTDDIFLNENNLDVEISQLTCIYNRDEQKKIVKSVANDLIEDLILNSKPFQSLRMPISKGRSYYSRNVSILKSLVAEKYPLLKSPYFSTEDETRWIATPNADDIVKYSAHSLGIRPYIPININLSAIEQITIARSVLEANMIVLSRLLPDAEIVVSDIPMR